MKTTEAAGSISARLDRLPATRTIWRLVALLSLGGFFEFYDLFFTGYIAPGLVRSGILTASTRRPLRHHRRRQFRRRHVLRTYSSALHSSDL